MLKKRLSELEMEYADEARRQETFGRQLKALFRINGKTVIDRNMAELMVKRIDLYPKGGIQITWNFDGAEPEGGLAK